MDLHEIAMPLGVKIVFRLHENMQTEGVWEQDTEGVWEQDTEDQVCTLNGEQDREHLNPGAS